ncbi:MAG TPA: cation:proton antiporter [Chloroflexaceae bacterium]|nr:cation:proton antiporter [Chloroflexaceae bacterium]
MSAHDLLVMMGVVLVASIGTQLLAAWLKLPAILPLLAVGVLLGPELLGLVESDALGIGLRVLIPLMVAVIVFEGGMVLDLDYLRQVGPAVRNLISVGCAVTALLAALAANLFAGLPWGLALLFGALVSVTGPTVINPLLRRASVTQRLKTILMAEGVLVDAVGVVLAVVVLEGLMVGLTPLEGAGTWVVRVGGGTLLGVVGGWLLGRGLRLVGRSFGAELTRLSALGGALAIYTLGEALSPEMGIAAAAAAGVVVGNMSFPHDEQVHHFKGDLTQIGIGVIFVLLAARLEFSDLLALGWGGVAVVLALMLVVRPASVFLSTIGTRLAMRERLFIAAVGPRGIVAASFATFAALRLEEAGYAGSEALAGLVFMVIIGTVVVQSFTTPWAARLLGVRPMLTVIVGADPLGRSLARHLGAQGEEVALVDRDPDNVAAAREEGLMAVQGDATQEAVLRKAGIERAQALVATTSSDKANLLVCRIARTRFGVDDVVARVNVEGALPTFTEAGIRAMSPLAASVMVLDNLLRRPSTLQLLTDLDAGKEVREVQLQNGGLAGRALREIRLDGDVLVAMIRRGGRLFVPHGDTALSAGDLLTLIGGSDDVASAAELFEREAQRGGGGVALAEKPRR